MTRLASLSLGGPLEPWLRAGLAGSDRALRFADVDLIVAEGSEGGLSRWAFDVADAAEIDGIATVTSAEGATGPRESPILGGRLLAVDHVVVMTDDLERTSRAVATVLESPLRRTRDAGGGVTQGFHRLDNTVIEIVGAPSNPRGASLWGFVGIVDDLDSVVAELRREFGDDAVSGPRTAVQNGQRIATLRSAMGLGAAVAVMSERPRSKERASGAAN